MKNVSYFQGASLNKNKSHDVLEDLGLLEIVNKSTDDANQDNKDAVSASTPVANGDPTKLLNNT